MGITIAGSVPLSQEPIGEKSSGQSRKGRQIREWGAAAQSNAKALANGSFT